MLDKVGWSVQLKSFSLFEICAFDFWHFFQWFFRYLIHFEVEMIRHFTSFQKCIPLFSTFFSNAKVWQRSPGSSGPPKCRPKRPDSPSQNWSKYIKVIYMSYDIGYPRGKTDGNNFAFLQAFITRLLAASDPVNSVWSCGSGSVRFDAMQQGLVSCEFTSAWKCECTSRLPKESPLPPIAIEQSSVPESSCFVIEVIQVVSKACLLPRQRRGTIAADWRSETIWEVAIRYLWPIQTTGTQTVWTGNEERQTKRCIHLWGVFDRVWPFCLGSCLSERWRLTDLMLVNPWGGWTFPMIFPLEVEFDRQTALLCFRIFSPCISGYIWLEIYKTMNTSQSPSGTAGNWGSHELKRSLRIANGEFSR